jgi:inhibitor of KinA sporulation pathway (predicted exonuclease)
MWYTIHVNLKNLLVVDVEATCWEKSDKTSGQSEIIEFGITTLNLESLEVSRSDGVFVKPTTSVVSPFCTRLTTLTPETVKDAPSFKDACGEIQKVFETDEHPWASWGDYDRKQVERQCAREHVENPFKGKHLNLKLMFAIAFKLKKEYGMAAALAHLGMDLWGTHHRGMDDSKNIANLAIAMFKKLRA